MPHIVAKDLVLRRGGRVILDDVSLSCSALGPTLIMGPNGAGKSVLLRVLHGLIAPDLGAVHVDDVPLSRALRKTQAMVFQTPVLLRRSVRSNITFALRTSGQNINAADAWLERAGLKAKADQPARSLSGGEAQLLAVARALACGPQTLFLDEPTSALDPSATSAVETLIQEAVSEGVQVIMVSHALGQIRRLATDVIMLHEGQIVETGPAADVLHNPKHAATQAYLNGDIVL